MIFQVVISDRELKEIFPKDDKESFPIALELLLEDKGFQSATVKEES